MTTPTADRPTRTIKLHWPFFTFSFRLGTERQEHERAEAIRQVATALLAGFEALSGLWKPAGKKVSARA